MPLIKETKTGKATAKQAMPLYGILLLALVKGNIICSTKNKENCGK